MEVVRQESIIKAASKMDIDQSTVSRALRSLEEAFGATLYIHYDKKFRLTEKGKIAHKYFMKMLETTDELKTSIRDPHGPRKEKLVICTTNGTALFYLIDAFKEFIESNKHVRFSLDTNDLVQELDGHRDISIGPMLPGDTIENFPLYTREYKLFASKGYLETHGHPQTPQELDHHRLIAYSRKNISNLMDFDWHLRYGSRNSVARMPFLQVSSSYALKSAAEKDMGIITFSKSYVDRHCPNLVDIFPHEKGLRVEKYFSYDTKNDKLPSIVLFRNFLFDFMRKTQ